MKNDPTLKELFLSQLKGQIPSLKEAFLMLKKEGDTAPFADNFNQMLHPLTGGASLCGLGNLSELLQGLESYFSKKPKLLEPDLAQLEESFAFLEECSSKNIDELDDFVALAPKPLTTKAPVAKTEPESAPEPAPQDSSMVELFLTELSSHLEVFNEQLLTLEKDPQDGKALDALMRAAHSVKGAARVVQLPALSLLAHKMEDCFVAAGAGKLLLKNDQMDVVFAAVDFIGKAALKSGAGLATWLVCHGQELEKLVQMLGQVLEGKAVDKIERSVKEEEDVPEVAGVERVVRVTADNLEKLMGLAGQSLVESRWLEPFAKGMLSMKREQHQLNRLVDECGAVRTEEALFDAVNKIKMHCAEMRVSFEESLAELDSFRRRHSILSDNLYHEVVSSRMRPFKDGVTGYPRMVRDLARQLEKEVEIKILGDHTPVDRDVLEKLKSPLTHLIRNSVDHGIEAPEARTTAGKPAKGTITLEAKHRAGQLHIVLRDDGRGIDCEKVRAQVVERKLNSAEVAANLTEAELMEFLFLPGFSTSAEVTDISGRGVGLDVVRAIVTEVGGRIRAESEPGKGLGFFMQLPITLSVVRSLIVEIAKEPYALPLSRLHGVALVPVDDIETVEGKEFFNHEEQNIGLIPASQILGKPPTSNCKDRICVVLLKDHLQCYGVAVDCFLGDKELVVQQLDPLLGNVPSIAAGALLENGDPLLMLDVEDLITAMGKMLASQKLKSVCPDHWDEGTEGRKKILVVDDSITVREVESRLLQGHGYAVDIAVDGVDGWNAVRFGNYDLVITDVDMPRMNGIELTRKIRADEALVDLPILIVSYKESDADRRLGLEAGANHYFTKRSFHDEGLMEAVRELIGDATRSGTWGWPSSMT